MNKRAELSAFSMFAGYEVNMVTPLSLERELQWPELASLTSWLEKDIL